MRQYVTTVIVAGLFMAGPVSGPAELAAQTLPSPRIAGPTPSSMAAPDDDSVFDELVGDVAEDFRRLPSVRAASILTIGGLGAAFAHSFDRVTTRSLSTSDELGDVFSAGQTVGGTHVQMAGALTTYTVGRLTSNMRVRRVGADLFRAQLVAQGLTAGIKLAVGRGRPDGTQFSFPSGHASTTFATATVLQRHLGWKFGVPAYAMATYVAASRVQVKRHFLSDVAFGAALGVVAGRSVTIGRGDATFAVAPAAAPGGAAVNVTWIGGR